MTCVKSAMPSCMHICLGKVDLPASARTVSKLKIRQMHNQKFTAQNGHCRTRLAWKKPTAAAATWNPQNVPGPQVTPSKQMSAVETVEAQLEALRENNKPWPNHGLLTMYEFGETIGGLERCYYFGHGKDLYHFDHFMGQFQNAYPELVNLESYSIEGSYYDEDVHKVLVRVTSCIDNSQSQFVFILARKDSGANKSALMTRRLIRHQPR